MVSSAVTPRRSPHPTPPHSTPPQLHSLLAALGRGEVAKHSNGTGGHNQAFVSNTEKIRVWGLRKSGASMTIYQPINSRRSVHILLSI